MSLFVGTSGYAYKEWKGAFYPRDLPAKKMLGYYAERFRSVEINGSFYRLPTAATVRGWGAEVPERFVFALKAPQQITHFKRLKGVAKEVREFVKVTDALESRRGPLLFQLPPNMKKDVGRLRDALAILPPGLRVAFEFRHPSWFDDETLDALRRHGAALCIADDAKDLEVPFVATADWGYLRLRRTSYTPAALRAWTRRILEQKWRDAFVFFMHEDTGTGPRYAAQMLGCAAASGRSATTRAALRARPARKPRAERQERKGR